MQVEPQFMIWPANYKVLNIEFPESDGYQDWLFTYSSPCEPQVNYGFTVVLKGWV